MPARKTPPTPDAPNSDINLPAQDILREPGQPTLNEVARRLLAHKPIPKPKRAPKK